MAFKGYTITTDGTEANARVRWGYDTTTGEMGMQVRLTNKTGGNSVKGYLVEPYDSADDSFANIVVDVPDPCWCVYEAGIADGQLCWVWKLNASICEMYFIGNVARSQLARGFLTADAGYVSGQVMAEDFPSPPFDADKHFYECGHTMRARTGAGLCLVHSQTN